MRHIVRLDAARGYCVLAVFAFHAGYLPFGWIGVQAFFVLSGFLITGILLQAKQLNSFDKYVITFYARRALRIFPVYYLYIFIIVVAAGVGGLYMAHKSHEISQINYAIPYLLLYMENIRAINDDYVNAGFYSHLWTLSVEEHFYLLWPLIVWFTPGRRLFSACVAVVIFSTLFRAGLLWYGGSEHFRTFAANRISFSQFDAFAIGAITQIIPRKKIFLTTRSFIISLSLVVAAGELIVAASRGSENELSYLSLGYTQDFPWIWSFVWGYTLLNVFFAHMIYILSNSADQGSKPLFGLFEIKQVANVGIISYGFYIYHDPLLTVSRYFHDHYGLSIYFTQFMALADTISISYAAITHPLATGGDL